MIKERVDKLFEKKEYQLYPKIPNNMLVELSNICNSKCIFCANSKMTRKKGFMNYEFLCHLLTEAYNLGVNEVGFYTTGEPLIYKKLDECIKFAKQVGYKYIYITTNGLLADIEKMKILIENGLDSIKFSINAITANDYKFIHGIDKFNTVLKNLKDVYNYRKVTNKKFKIFVSYIATRYTDYDINEIKNFFSEFCDEVVVVNVRNQSGMMTLENEMLKCYDESGKVQSNRLIPCHYLFNVINVSYEGYLTACCTDFQNYLAYADLKKSTLLESWTNSVITKLRQDHLEHNLSNNLCYNCIYSCSKVPEPLVQELSTIINDKCLNSLIEFNNRIEREENENGNSRFIKCKKRIDGGES